MKKLSLFILLLSPVFAFGQTDDFRKLFCKSWTVSYYIEKGKKQYPDEREKNNTLTFNTDSTFNSAYGSGFGKGKWTYNEKTKMVSLKFPGDKERVAMKIVKLKSGELIVDVSMEGRTGRMAFKAR